MEYIALGLLFLGLALIGVSVTGVVLLARATLSLLLNKNQTTLHLERERRKLHLWIKRNESLKYVLQSRGDPNWYRVEAAINIKRAELAALTDKITQRKIEKAERDALE